MSEPTIERSATAVAVPVEELFTDNERSAFVGFLAGYSGQTRAAYTLDLRQYTSWCDAWATAVRGEAGRHRVLRPRPSGTWPGAGHDHAPVVHGLRVLPLRGRRRPVGPLPRRPRTPTAAGLRITRHRAGPQRGRRSAGRRRPRHTGRPGPHLAAHP